jgi:excisionase family DNA binding protein
VVCWWALQDSNLRPLPCESAQGSRQTYTSLGKSSQSLEIAKSDRSDHRHDLATFFPRLGPNWVQPLTSKQFPAQGSEQALLSVRQTAELLGVSTATVYRLCERGELRHCRISCAIRITSPDLAALIESTRAQPYAMIIRLGCSRTSNIRIQWGWLDERSAGAAALTCLKNI